MDVTAIQYAGMTGKTVSPDLNGEKLDGLEENIVLLHELSDKLDEYFSIPTLGIEK